MGLNHKSDSGYFSEFHVPSNAQDTLPNFHTQFQEFNRNGRMRTSSFPDVTSRYCSVDEIMEEFKLNGTDSPYNPEEDFMIRNRYRNNYGLNGTAPSGYLRQKSYPAPDATPAVPLPQLEDFQVHSSDDLMWSVANNGVPSEDPAVSIEDMISEEQLSVLNSLPTAVIYYLLKEMERNGVLQNRTLKKYEFVECRFCKNNGETESYYRSHRLRYRGRLTCPVLRAYRCQRCGAGGDAAHTLKYCPLATDEQKMVSTAMMRSMHTANGRRRYSKAPSINVAGNYDEMVSNLYRNDTVYYNYEPLDPIWEALEKKLML